MSEPNGGPERPSRVVRQLRHDLDDVYELVAELQLDLTTVADEQTRQGEQLTSIESTQRRILDLLLGA